MNLASYIEKINQMELCDLEAFVNLPHIVIGDEANVSFQSRDLQLLVKKIQGAVELIEVEGCDHHLLDAIIIRRTRYLLDGVYDSLERSALN